MAASLAVVTWNVLHRVHGVNWDEEGVIERYPDERVRLATIAARLATCDADVICLQEASGDLVVALRAAVGGGDGEVFASPYPRVPHYYRRFEPPQLADPNEYLVTIVRAPGARLVGSEAFATDPGKGFQIVEVDGATVVCTHVSYGERMAAQCARLVEAVDGVAGMVVVCGDFNADRDACSACLGAAFACAVPPVGAAPTRPRTDGSDKAQMIDHVFVRGGRIVEAAVLDAAGASDHNPLRVRIEVGVTG